jgi:hypothetical protein
MALVFNGNSVTIDSFKVWTRNFEDLSCLSLDLNKINVKGTFGPTIGIVFTDDKGNKHQGLNLYSGYEKQCGDTYGEKYKTYSINIQRYHSPLSLFTKENEIIREPTESDASVLFACIEKIRERMIDLVNAEVTAGTIRSTGNKKDDGAGKLYVKSTDFTGTEYTQQNGRSVEMLNPIMRIKISNRDGIIFTPQFFSDNSQDELKQKGIPLTIQNAVVLIPKRTLVRPMCKIGEIRATDKGFMLGAYINGLAIKRQVSNFSTNLEDDETETDQFGRMSLED